MKDIPAIYGSMVFNDTVMRERLPDDIYKALRRTIENGSHFELDIANAVALAMKDWAVEKGATHFSHWFQPMTGVTAEKHDSFIAPDNSGHIIMEFSGKELIKGEPDASSFPSGGLRATFEARGYTAWDPTSYAFIRGTTLYIPTAFCSYSGQALDKKTPLLRSMDAINSQAMRIMRLFDDKSVKHVVSTAGAEQEYFLIDKSMYQKRPDIQYTGRTLIGAKPPKGQELEDHYFGAIKPRVSAFMKELDEELWKLGVPAKTKHNETAPAQHELATVYTVTNVAADHNQITMELMKSIAMKHNMVCLLHEKPFAGVNGSGKHNNWSLATDTGLNLLDPGDTPSHNARFLLFLSAVIKAVDENQDLLRISVAGAGNDHRLGAHEAPPAIISIFLGDELTELLEYFQDGKEHNDKRKSAMQIGAAVLPHIPKDIADRNRTSPFAFTGNKFELRMLGSSASIADCNIVLNTIVADALSQFADVLEKSDDFEADLDGLIKSVIAKHKRIIFNGNNYTYEWENEAKKRGLLNLRTTVDALPHFILEKNIALFERHNVYSASEIHSRYEIFLESYSKIIQIEALTLLDMIKKEVLPASLKAQNKIAQTALSKKQLIPEISILPEEQLLLNIAKLCQGLYTEVSRLETSLQKVKEYVGDVLKVAKYCRETIFSSMSALRGTADELESLIPKGLYPYPSYAEMLYSV